MRFLKCGSVLPFLVDFKLFFSGINSPLDAFDPVSYIIILSLVRIINLYRLTQNVRTLLLLKQHLMDLLQILIMKNHSIKTTTSMP